MRVYTLTELERVSPEGLEVLSQVRSVANGLQ